MALYTVGRDGNAPKNAQAGDKIVTGGGTYEVLDSRNYAGMNKDQLAQAGVAYNPASGLYSRKIADASNSLYTPKTGSYDQVTSNSSSLLKKITGLGDISYLNADKYEQLADASYRNQKAQLEKNYSSSLSDLKRTYNESLANYNTQIDDANHNAENNRQEAMDRAYQDSINASIARSSRGMTSSAQGMAQDLANYVNADKNIININRDRDKMINDIKTNINKIANDYNINRDQLKTQFNADKLSALSTRDLAYLKYATEVDKYNADVYNNAAAKKSEMDWQAEQAAAERAWKSGEAEKDRALQRYAASLSGRGSYGGYGDSNTGDSNYDIEYNKASAYINYWTNKGITPGYITNASAMAEDIYAGKYTADDINKYLMNIWNKKYGKSTNSSSSNSSGTSSSVNPKITQQVKRSDGRNHTSLRR